MIELGDEYEGIPVFEVGGSVRDDMRGVDSQDVDLAVAEVDGRELRERGFEKIDTSDAFPVFHDSQGREVAICREEVSTGSGYKEFDVEPVSPVVPAAEAIERDLARRDFTVNAMARNVRTGKLHDPFDGQQDLKDGVIRHVSLEEDALRVLRAARFAARLEARVADETKDVMTRLAPRMMSLPGERIRMELEKVLVQADHPSQFFTVLAETEALQFAFPEIDRLRSVPAGPEQYHAEGTAFAHTMMVLEEVKRALGANELALLMALYHDVGKGKTPTSEYPHHYAHGEYGLDIINAANDRLKFSNKQLDAMKVASKEHMRLKNLEEMKEKTVYDTWQRIDDHYVEMKVLMRADALGRVPRGSFDEALYAERFLRAEQATNAISGQNLIDDGCELEGEKFGKELRDRRISHMKHLRNQKH